MKRAVFLAVSLVACLVMAALDVREIRRARAAGIDV